MLYLLASELLKHLSQFVRDLLVLLTVLVRIDIMPGLLERKQVR